MNRKVVALVAVMVLLLPFLLSIICPTLGHTRYPWPMFRHDPRHIGYTPSPGPTTNQSLWIYDTGYDVYGPSPAVVNGIVYIGGGYGTYVYAFDAVTGALIWQYNFGYWVSSSPAVADGKVYVGSFGTNVTALDANTGEFIWNYTTGDWLAASSPAVVNGIVYIGGGYGKTVYALNATTGTQIWNYTTGDWTHSSPAVAGGIVYIGSYDGKVYALNATTGAFIWSHPTGGDVFSSPAVADGKVYVGSYDFKVYCLDASNGSHIWNYTTQASVASSPAVVDGTVYVGSFDNNTYALNASTGAKIWNYTTGGAISSSPSVAGGIVYIGSGDYKVYALNASMGAKIWSYTTGSDAFSSPAIAYGVVYTASRDGKVYAIGPPPTVFRVFDIVVEEIPYSVTALSNSSISALELEGTQISFNVTSPDAASGFCNVTIPDDLLWVDALEEWVVTIDGTPVSRTATHNGTHYSIYFTYPLDTHEVVIEGTWVVPEFPAALVLLLFMNTILVVTILGKLKGPGVGKQKEAFQPAKTSNLS